MQKICEMTSTFKYPISTDTDKEKNKNLPISVNNHGNAILCISPFQGKSVHLSVAIFTMPPGSYFGHQDPTPIYLNGEILICQKLLTHI